MMIGIIYFFICDRKKKINIEIFYTLLLRYMHTVRLGATRVRGLSWKIYDEQFRLKMSMDSTTCWDAVDQEL